MTPLAQSLIRRIQATGPITIADYMADCLLHPEHGYYTTRDPLGAKGDFTTAPEISQMFGELIGLSIAQAWIDQGQPTPFTLAELGPGRGTLMADLLRATAAVPGFHDAARLCLVERSPVLKAAQAETVTHPAIHWIDDVQDLPDTPLFIAANEFFDALAIRQFQRDLSGWRERQVGVQGGALCLGLSEPAPIKALAHRIEDTKPDDLVETCAPALPIIEILANRIAKHGGAGLIVDYGDWRSQGDTLQALQNHEPVDLFAEPGQTDLTAHVDFEALAQAASDVRYSRLTPQGVFLERLGITPRAQRLAENLTGPALEAHIAAHRRLTHPAEMGSLFKVLALYPDGMLPPPGVDP